MQDIFDNLFEYTAPDQFIDPDCAPLSDLESKSQFLLGNTACLQTAKETRQNGAEFAKFSVMQVKILNLVNNVARLAALTVLVAISVVQIILGIKMLPVCDTWQ